MYIFIHLGKIGLMLFYVVIKNVGSSITRKKIRLFEFT